MARDEMVDGNGGLHPQWRNLLSVIAGFGHDELADRSRRLERVIPRLSDQNPCAQSRSPMDMMVQG